MVENTIRVTDTIVIAGKAFKEEVVLKCALILGIAGLIMIFVLAVLLTLSMIKISKLNRKYAAFMKGASGKDLESSVLSRFKEMDKIKSDVEFISGKPLSSGWSSKAAAAASAICRTFSPPPPIRSWPWH